MKPVLIYDGHCNLCVGFVKTLETFHQNQQTEYAIDMIPYQHAQTYIECFHLSQEELEQAFHLITSEGKVYKAGAAIQKLAEIYPLLKIGSGFFATSLGESVYRMIAGNRYSVFGCQEECYLPEVYRPKARS